MSSRPIRGIASPNESFSPERKVAYMTHQADKNKVALITGITGQDGAYLADFLLQRGYTVHGIKRRASLLNTDRIDYLYRDRHDAGVRLFLHYGDMTDSPIRGQTFVTRKITRAVAAIERGFQDKLYLGNLDAKRDWGHARDYVEGMWRILQQDQPDDYVLATGETHTVREFVELAFRQIDRTIEWSGSGADERGRCKKTGKLLVALDAAYRRPTEVDLLLGDPAKAITKLGWKHHTSFEQLVTEMVEADRTILRTTGARRHEPVLHAAQ